MGRYSLSGMRNRAPNLSSSLSVCLPGRAQPWVNATNCILWKMVGRYEVVFKEDRQVHDHWPSSAIFSSLSPVKFTVLNNDYLKTSPISSNSHYFPHIPSHLIKMPSYPIYCHILEPTSRMEPYHHSWTEST